MFIATADLEQQVSQLSVRTVTIASILLVIFIAIAALSKKHLGKKHSHLKLPLFILIASTLVVPTLILLGSTVYLNTKAESKGPVHWHSDIEFWVCGSEVELRNPTGFLSNKIGTATYHEHNDKRIHLEGVVVKKSEDASLDKFMRVVGGQISQDRLGIPLNESSDEWLVNADDSDGDTQNTDNLLFINDFVSHGADGPVLQVKNDDNCNGKPAQLQVFVYTYNKEDETYSQRKLVNGAEYVMRDEPNVPPGDCVIVEFDSPKATTDRLCLQYGVRDTKRCTDFGVKEYTSELCNLRQVTTTGGGRE